MILLAWTNALLLFVLAVIHLYWGLGGKWGLTEALPTRQNGDRIFNPRWFDSLIVGMGLAFFGSMHLIKVGVIRYGLPGWFDSSILWIIGAIFLLRSVGDFRYVGFFKSFRDTPFGRKDTKFYSPLCLIVGTQAALIEYLL